MKSKPRDPVAIAKILRKMFEQDIPKSWENYWGKNKDMDAYRMTLLIQEQVGNGFTFEDAGAICAQVCPELFAEYWENLAYPKVGA